MGAALTAIAQQIAEDSGYPDSPVLLSNGKVIVHDECLPKAPIIFDNLKLRGVRNRTGR